MKKTNKKAKSQVCKARILFFMILTLFIFIIKWNIKIVYIIYFKIYLGQEILRVFYLFVLEALKIKYFDLKLANMGKNLEI